MQAFRVFIYLHIFSYFVSFPISLPTNTLVEQRLQIGDFGPKLRGGGAIGTAPRDGLVQLQLWHVGGPISKPWLDPQCWDCRLNMG